MVVMVVGFAFSWKWKSFLSSEICSCFLVSLYSKEVKWACVTCLGLRFLGFSKTKRACHAYLIIAMPVYK